MAKKTTHIIAKVTINAPLSFVFQTVADVGNLQNVFPSITDIKFLSDQRRGPGTHYRETRLVGRRIQTRNCCIIGCVEDQYVQFLSAFGRSLWVSTFSVLHLQRNVELKAERYPLGRLSFLANVLYNLSKTRALRSLEAEIVPIKTFCEFGMKSDDD